MIKYGYISEVDPAKGLARVKFDQDDDIVSGWLVVLQGNTLENKDAITFDINEQVACFMDSNNEDGVILGSYYSEANTLPAGAGADTWIKKFKDGTVFKYDRAAHEYSVISGTTTFKITKNGGFKLENGSENLKSIISDLLDGISLITVVASSFGAPTSPPANEATFTAIKARLNNLFN